MAMQAPRWLSRSITRVETADDIDGYVGPLRAVSAFAAAGQRGQFLRGEWLGHALHPLATDLPLGCWTASGLLDLLGGRGARRAAQRLVGLGLAFVPLTSASGLADWDGLKDPARRRVGVVHAVGNGMVAMLYLTSWRQRRAGHHARGVLMGLMGGSLAIVTGYLGGHLSFGRSASVEPRGLISTDVVDTGDDVTVAYAFDDFIGPASAVDRG